MKVKLLSVLFLICAGLCIVYFGVIIGYSGIGTSLCLVWLLFAAVFAGMSIMLRKNQRKNREGMPEMLPTFIITSFVLALSCFIFIMHMVMSASRSYGQGEQRADYCIVMGARVYSNGISRTLMYRLDEAMDLYHRSPGTVFVLAGGQEAGDPIPEAFAMYNYLSLNGIPGDNMLLEAKAESTYGIITSAVRAVNADFEKRRIPRGPGDRFYPPDYAPSVGIITSDYHMYRSVTFAKANGIANPIAIAAASDSVLYIHNCVRESIAIVKDFFMGKVTVDEEHMPRIPFNSEKKHRGA